MNLDNHEIEIKSKLLQHREVINTDDVWAALEPELHPKKKRRFFAYWIFGGLSLIFVAALWFTFSAGSQHEESALIEPMADAQANRPSTQESKIVKENTDYNNNSKNNFDNHNHIAKNEGRTQNTQATTKTIETQQTISKNKTIEFAQANANISIVKNQTTPVSTDNINVFSSRENTLNTTERFSTNILEKENQTKAALDPVKNIQLNYSQLPILSISLLNAEQKLNQTNEIFISELKTREKRKSSFDTYSLVGWGAPRIQYRSDDESEEGYVSHQNEINRGISSQHAQIGLRYNVKNYYVQCGLDYSRRVLRTRLNEVTMIDTMVNGVQAIYYKKSGEVEQTTGGVNAVVRRETDIQWHTYRQSINMPLVIGYKHQLGQFSIGGQLGANIRLSHRATGAYLNEEDRLIKFSATDQTNPYRTNFSVSYLGGLHVGYQLNPRTEMQLVGNYEIFPSQSIQFDSQINEVLKSGHLSIGVFYRL